MNNQAMKQIAVMLLAILFGFGAWGCSGDDPAGEQQAGIASTTGTGAAGNAGNASASGGTSSGSGGQEPAGGTGNGSASGGEGPLTGGSSGAGGNEPVTGGSAGDAGASGGTSGGAGQPATGGSSGAGNGGTSGNSGSAGSGGSAGESGSGGNAGFGAGGTAGTGGITPFCTPGDEIACLCLGSSIGVQVCNAEGTAYGPCDCSGTGGAAGQAGSAGQAGAAGQSGYGGMAGISGSAGSGGSAGYGAGAGAAGQAGMAGAAGQAVQPFSCSGWMRDTSFPTGMDLTHDLWGSGSNDIYVTVSKYGSDGGLVHWNGSSWSYETLPATTNPVNQMIAVWGSSADDVWAGGSTMPTSPGTATAFLMHRVNQGAWVEVSLGLPVGTVPVRSIWGANENDIFMLVDYIPGGWDARIYRKNGNSWDAMTLPSHAVPMRLRSIWGYSAHEVYAVGHYFDAENEPSGAVLWKYDGNAWADITTLPSNLVEISDIHGNPDGEIFVGGITHDGSIYHGARLSTTDLVNWSLNESSVSIGDGAVWTPRKGAALTTGNRETPPADWAAYASTISQGTWTETPIGQLAQCVNDIWGDPDTNEVWISTHHKTGNAGVYVSTCQ